MRTRLGAWVRRLTARLRVLAPRNPGFGDRDRQQITAPRSALRGWSADTLTSTCPGESAAARQPQPTATPAGRRPVTRSAPTVGPGAKPIAPPAGPPPATPPVTGRRGWCSDTLDSNLRPR